MVKQRVLACVQFPVVNNVHICMNLSFPIFIFYREMLVSAHYNSFEYD